MELKEARKRFQGKYFKLYDRYWLRIIHIICSDDNITSIIAECIDDELNIYYDIDSEFELGNESSINLVRITKSEFLNKIKNRKYT